MSAVALHSEISRAADAPPLLLGGSLGTTLAMWEPQVRALSARLRTVAFDHRGHGGSPVPAGPYTIAELGQDVIALMDRLGLEPAPPTAGSRSAAWSVSGWRSTTPTGSSG